MPTYEYKCTKCGNVQENFHSMNSSEQIKCEKCNSKCEKQFSANTNIIFKGNGWPDKERRMKSQMLNKNSKMKSKMNDREKAGEAVTSIADLKNKK